MEFPLLRASGWLMIAAGIPITVTSSHAAQCPGGVASLHPRLVAGALLVIPVTVQVQQSPVVMPINIFSIFH